jgi:hypothetical protein
VNTSKHQRSAELKELEEDAGKGTSQRLEDYAWWLRDDLHRRPWIGTIVTIDKTNGIHRNPLLNLLRSQEAIRNDERWHLANLLQRRQFSDPTALEMLRGTGELTRAQRSHLADQIAQCELRRPPGRPETPSYKLTAADARREWDAEQVRQYQKHGGRPGGKPMRFRDALDKVAPNIDYANTLEAHIRKALGSSRRMEKRRPKA